MGKNIVLRWKLKIEAKLNTYSIHKKLLLLYLFCVILPLVLTDSVIIAMVFREEHETRERDMKNIADAVEYSIDKTIDDAISLSKNIYLNRYINAFLNTDFESPLDYYDEYQKLIQDSLFDSSLGTSSVVLTMYADNDSIVNGGKFQRLEKVKEEEWYQTLVESGKDMIFYSYLDESYATSQYPIRKVSVIRKLNYYKRDPYEKVLKIDMDYNGINMGLQMAKYESEVYVCNGNRIVFSNLGNNNLQEKFDVINTAQLGNGAYRQEREFFGQTLDIYVLYPQMKAGHILRKNMGLILFLICVNALLPLAFMRLLNDSFTVRLKILGETFKRGRRDELMEVQNVTGTDEISQLMKNYNYMASRTNHLIETVYKSRLKQQEANIARQKAELLALHSQINPHFLFNVLENIRMRSILKHEEETADMIEQLSVMERQYVDWGTDIVSLESEMSFVESYLKLQKYRFGDRLTYRLEIEESCKMYRIPKLSLVTFTENACVHGIEGKASKCWIFVRVYQDEKNLYLEVEDTGNGMPEEYLSYLRERMETADIEMLKENGRVGVINACLRLKMCTENQVKFRLESEKGVGTEVAAVIPLESMRR